MPTSSRSPRCGSGAIHRTCYATRDDEWPERPEIRLESAGDELPQHGEANFWRSLKRVGNAGTLQVLGTPHCGKGEPSQAIRVGHATPACVFGNVDVFGGES
jgi:hypothetical protein